MVILKGYERVKGAMETGKQIVNPETGEFFAEKVDYDNVILHYQSTDRKEVKGIYCENVKAKMENLRVIGVKSLDEALNKEVQFGFDMTVKVDNIGKVKPVITTIFVIGDVK